MLARASTRLSPALAASALALVTATPAVTPVALAASAKGRASVMIAQAIVVSEAVPMSFADVAPPASGGAIVLTATGRISSSAGFIFHGKPAAGTFEARGVPNHPTTVAVTSGTPVIGPGPAMRLSAFTNDAAPSFDGAARLSFAVGATLVVNPNQTPGQYTGTYAVTVNF